MVNTVTKYEAHITNELITKTMKEKDKKFVIPNTLIVLGAVGSLIGSAMTYSDSLLPEVEQSRSLPGSIFLLGWVLLGAGAFGRWRALDRERRGE